MSNRTDGNKFEQAITDFLGTHGFWAHRLVQSPTGQPADIIAVKNKKAYLIDCKVCSRQYFELSRIEINQELAMTKWRDCRNGEGLFCIGFGKNIYMVSLKVFEKTNQNRVTESFCQTNGLQIEKWVKQC